MMTKESKTFESALLTKSEPEWLLGETHISRPYEGTLRFNIRNKLETLTEFELPLLIGKSFIQNNSLTVTANCNAITIDSNAKETDSCIKKSDPCPFVQNKEEALAGIWTRDLCLTKATLYQAELPRHYD